jgi:hypothetical protein
VFLTKSKDGDYHQEMNSFATVFLEWLENQLMPALKNPSLVALFLATKTLTCAHINSIGLSSVSNGGSYYLSRSVIEPIIIDCCDDDSDDYAG